MNLNRTIFTLILFALSAPADAQVIKNCISNLNIIGHDSARINIKSPLSLIMLNYQTGEAVFKAKAESFKSDDSTLKKFFFQKSNDLELHFIITKSVMDLLARENKEHTAETEGMLYINNHFHNVSISYSIYNKNGTTIDFSNNNIWFSFQCNFIPSDYQLDWLDTFTNEPILLWLSKQPINFTNTN